jgi:hypothetical protein
VWGRRHRNVCRPCTAGNRLFDGRDDRGASVFRFSPSDSSIAPERIAPIGFATSLPARSGADPWTGSKSRRHSLSWPTATGPAIRTPHRLRRENVAESIFRHHHVEARRRQDELHRSGVDILMRQVTSGYSRPISVTTSRHSRETSSTFALSTTPAAAGAIAQA